MSRPYIFSCNGAKGPKGAKPLDYRKHINDRNVNIGLPRFIEALSHIPERLLDLLEIASYVFSADRSALRGHREAVEYHSWSREMNFHIKVRDFDFWSASEVIESLEKALTFMTGDKSYSFNFQPGHETDPADLFDLNGLSPSSLGDWDQVTLFSGGLDSLAGVVESITEKKKTLLISHQSQPGSKKTQTALYKSLKGSFPDSVFQLPFECNLHGTRATEETQRTRAILYTSIAAVAANVHGLNSVSVYENGVTSINLHRREDLISARASRTTHPQTMSLLSDLFSLVFGQSFEIELPYIYLTKADVIQILHTSPSESLISSAVSCNRTFQSMEQATHCGCCFQCIDRRLASSMLQDTVVDHEGLYALDIFSQPLTDRETRGVLIDYLRQASDISKMNEDYFYEQYISEITEVGEGLKRFGSQIQIAEKVWKLYKQHSSNILNAIQFVRAEYDNPFASMDKNSFQHIIADRDYLKPDPELLAEDIVVLVENSIPQMFRDIKPKDENDLNLNLASLLETHDPELRSEHPTSTFACASVRPDHSTIDDDVVIESKYIRKGTTPSKASDGIAADMIKYPQKSFKLFLVYDPWRAIKRDDKFTSDFEGRGKCRIQILR